MMGQSMPANPTEYGSLDGLPEDIQKYCEEVHDELTIDQLNTLADYFRSKADKLRNLAAEKVTLEDFEDAKKDVDDDEEEGEKAY